MSTASLLEALANAESLLAKFYEKADAGPELGSEYSRVMSRLAYERTHPPGLTIGPASSKAALEKGHVFEVELPSGCHVSLPGTLDTLVALNDWVRQRENELEKARSEKSHRNIISSLGVGTKASPVQYDIDKALVSGKYRRFNEQGIDVREEKKDFNKLSPAEQAEFMAKLMAAPPTEGEPK